MSHRDGDGEDTTASGDDTFPPDEEFSAEDEFSRWAEDTEAGPDRGGRWSGLGRPHLWTQEARRRAATRPGEMIETPQSAASTEPQAAVHEPSPADLENPEPDQLDVPSNQPR